jgi:hypothetical protein
MLTSLIIWSKNETTKNYNIGTLCANIDIYAGISFWIMLLSKYCNQNLSYIGHFHTLIIVPVFYAFKIHISVIGMKFVYLNWLLWYIALIVLPPLFVNYSSNLFCFSSLYISGHQNYCTSRRKIDYYYTVYNQNESCNKRHKFSHLFPEEKVVYQLIIYIIYYSTIVGRVAQ